MFCHMFTSAILMRREILWLPDGQRQLDDLNLHLSAIGQLMKWKMTTREVAWLFVVFFCFLNCFTFSLSGC